MNFNCWHVGWSVPLGQPSAAKKWELMAILDKVSHLNSTIPHKDIFSIHSALASCHFSLGYGDIAKAKTD
jgi:hypothetical protein